MEIEKGKDQQIDPILYTRKDLINLGTELEYK